MRQTGYCRKEFAESPFIHVYPVNDGIRHNLKEGASGCRCEPEVEHAPNGKIIVLHQKINGRLK